MPCSSGPAILRARLHPLIVAVIAAAVTPPSVMLSPASLSAQEVAPLPTGTTSPPDSLLAALLPASLRSALLSASPELGVRRSAVAATEARRDAVGYARPAVLSLESEESPDGRLDRGTTSLVVSRGFLPSGQRRAERAVAAAAVRATEIALDAGERRVLARGARAFAQAVGWRAVAARLAAQDSLLASTETSLRTRFAVGDARYVDVLRLRTERLHVQTERAVARTEAEMGVLELSALLGREAASEAMLIALLDSATVEERHAAAAGVGVAGIAPTLTAAALPPAPSLEALVALARDVRLADAQLDRATAAHRLVLAGQQPAVSASLGLQRIGAEGDGSASLGPVLSASVSLPFTARRANRAAAVAAERDVVTARAARAATEAAVHGALAAARARYESARARLAEYDAALLRAAREERESALAAYRTGDLSLLELLDFERALARAETDRTRAALDALAALADLLSGAPTGESLYEMTATDTDPMPITGSTGETDDR